MAVERDDGKVSGLWRKGDTCGKRCAQLPGVGGNGYGARRVLYGEMRSAAAVHTPIYLSAVLAPLDFTSNVYHIGF